MVLERSNMRVIDLTFEDQSEIEEPLDLDIAAIAELAAVMAERRVIKSYTVGKRVLMFLKYLLIQNETLSLDDLLLDENSPTKKLFEVPVAQQPRKQIRGHPLIPKVRDFAERAAIRQFEDALREGGVVKCLEEAEHVTILIRILNRAVQIDESTPPITMKQFNAVFQKLVELQAILTR